MGEYVNGLMDGQGVLYEEDGLFYYEGQFSKGLFTAKEDQEFYDSNGNVYVGSFVNGKKEGWGK